MGDMATRSSVSAADVSAPNVDLTDLNRRIADEAAAVTTADGRNKAAPPAPAAKPDDAA